MQVLAYGAAAEESLMVAWERTFVLLEARRQTTEPMECQANLKVQLGVPGKANSWADVQNRLLR